MAPFLLPVKNGDWTMTMLRGTRIVTGKEAATMREIEGRFRSYLHRGRG